MWVTGNSGAGKSTVCEVLKSRGEPAFDADWEGYSHWVDRVSGRVVTDPPYPVPPGWLDRYGWQISRAKVAALAASLDGQTGFLCGSAENEADVRDRFDRVVCLVAGTATIRERLLSRTGNAFGRNPGELAAALDANAGGEAAYRRLGATIIDGTCRPDEVADAILALGAA